MADRRLPREGEFWRIVSGQGQGLLLKIIRLPETTPSESPYAIARIEGRAGDERNIPLDDRWGVGIVLAHDIAVDEIHRQSQMMCKDRLSRLGLDVYRTDDHEAVLHEVMRDFATAYGTLRLTHTIEGYKHNGS